MTAIDKSASDKANPTGEIRARKLIRWYNEGAGGKIRWGTPGDFDACVAIAGKHMTPDQAKGFCSNRHKDATGARPGKAPAERATRTRKASLLRRYLELRNPKASGSPATKAIDGQRTYDEISELVNRAIRLATGADDNGYCWVRALNDEWAVFEFNPKGGTPTLYQVRYQLGMDGSVALGEPFPVEQHTDFDPATKALTFGTASPMSTSAMVALYPPKDVAEALALGGGYDPADLHITLAFLGSDAVLRTSRDSVTAVLAPLAGALSPLEGSVSGIGRFTPEIPPGTGEAEWPLVALIDIPALPEFRQQLVAALGAAGVDVATNHGFCPHMTLAMVGPDDEWAAGQILAAGVEATPLRFGEIVLSWGDERIAFPLGGRSPETEATDAPAMKAVQGPVIKSAEEKRYTLAPLYPASPELPSASHLDAHGDFATADDLQAAVWDHVRKGDRAIRDQHRDGTVIGEWVEIVSWPYEVTVPLTGADGSVVNKSFAPGTVFLGVVWSEAGWEDIRKGRKTGYSLGGAATRVDVGMA